MVEPYRFVLDLKGGELLLDLVGRVMLLLHGLCGKVSEDLLGDGYLLLLLLVLLIRHL